MRGGSWYIKAYHLRSANRGFNTPYYRNHTIGFRLAAALTR
jgi:formylglycine-generating enzyme required for sulfatase activity